MKIVVRSIMAFFLTIAWPFLWAVDYSLCCEGERPESWKNTMRELFNGC